MRQRFGGGAGFCQYPTMQRPTMMRSAVSGMTLGLFFTTSGLSVLGSMTAAEMPLTRHWRCDDQSGLGRTLGEHVCAPRDFPRDFALGFPGFCRYLIGFRSRRADARQQRKHIFVGGFLVGVAGFEPATPTSRTWCATRLRYAVPQSAEPNTSRFEHRQNTPAAP